MKRETAENLIEAWELANDCLLSTQRDRLRYCISQVVIEMLADVIEMLADDGGDDA